MELLATDFPSDIYLIEQYIAPMFRGTLEFEHIMESLHVIRAVDEIPKQVKRRNPEHKGVSYHVGQIFRHRRYNYTAIITGWDSECGAGEQWMRRMGIDQLQSGRHQSFYHVMCVNYVLMLKTEKFANTIFVLALRTRVSGMLRRKTFNS
jgi:F-box protein 21